MRTLLNGRSRPKGRHAAPERREEIASPHYSITSLAATSKVCGMTRPNAFAVLILMIKSNLVVAEPADRLVFRL
jgi:hypothetical protein